MQIDVEVTAASLARQLCDNQAQFSEFMEELALFADVRDITFQAQRLIEDDVDVQVLEYIDRLRGAILAEQKGSE